MISFGSVCSGIESASVAWEPLGMRAAWLSEVDAAPSKVLAHHWPHVPNMGNMCALPSYLDAGYIDAPDVLVGGTPCQAFSVAGARASMGDARGQLTLTYVEIANAIDRKRPGAECVTVWENVPGVLNTKDNAFGCFLGALAGEVLPLQPAGPKWTNSGCVFGPKRTIAWRVLDAQYFGVAQRRRRVFVVASARTGFDPARVLFERGGVRRDTPPSREAGEDITPTVTARARSPQNCGGNLIALQNATRGAGQNGLGVSEGGPMYTLDTASQHGVLHEGAPRRLTPLECERLQGFPDNYTNVAGLPDSARYKALGNSKAVPVVRWVGCRIIMELLK